jgi:hypothetical protein
MVELPSDNALTALGTSKQSGEAWCIVPVCLSDTWLNQVIERICHKGRKDKKSRSSRTAQHFSSCPISEPKHCEINGGTLHRNPCRWIYAEWPRSLVLTEDGTRREDQRGYRYLNKVQDGRIEVKRWLSGLSGWRKAGPGMHK